MMFPKISTNDKVVVIVHTQLNVERTCSTTRSYGNRNLKMLVMTRTLHLSKPYDSQSTCIQQTSPEWLNLTCRLIALYNNNVSQCKVCIQMFLWPCDTFVDTLGLTLSLCFLISVLFLSLCVSWSLSVSFCLLVSLCVFLSLSLSFVSLSSIAIGLVWLLLVLYYKKVKFVLIFPSSMASTIETTKKQQQHFP
jgi:hypothetical protein